MINFELKLISCLKVNNNINDNYSTFYTVYETSKPLNYTSIKIEQKINNELCNIVLTK